MKLFTLTWLPSFCQKTAGWGFPFVSHGKVAVRPWATIWSLGRMTNWGAARVKGKKTLAVSRLVVHSEAKHQGWRLLGLGDFKQKKQAIYHMVKSKWECCTELPCSFISVFCSLMALNRGENTNDYHFHGNQVGHSSRWGWGWMNDSHIGIHTRQRLGHNGIKIGDNTHAPETSNTTNRYRHTGLIMSDFPCVRFCLHHIAS